MPHRTPPTDPVEADAPDGLEDADLLGFDDLAPDDPTEDEDEDEDDRDVAALPPLPDLASEDEPDPILDGDDDGGALLDLPDLSDDADEEDRAPALPGATLALAPWRTDAQLPELALTVPALLDPTARQTVWSSPDCDHGEIETLVVVAGVTVRVAVRTQPEPTEQLRVGRDVLAGRILVDSSAD
jgi:hypothetical protein